MIINLILTFLVLFPLYGKACPGSNALVHAKCEMSITFKDSCDAVNNEITGRINSNTWTDPHNGGTYSLTASNATYIAGQRVTGDQKFTDLFDFYLTSTVNGCSVEGCSESQVTSIADFSTNYCNLHSLYCSSEDGCPTVGTDLSYSETYTACAQHDDVCVATEVLTNKSKVTDEDACEADIQEAEKDITDAGYAIADAVVDCVDGLTSSCNADLNRALDDVINASKAIDNAVHDCGAENTACYDDLNKLVQDLSYSAIYITDAIVDCANDAKKCAEDSANAAKALADAGKDIADAINDC